MQKLIDARKAQGLTQQDLAEKSGIAQSTISQYENGAKVPTLNTLRRLGVALKVNWFDLAG